MVQIDVFLAGSLGAGLALAARKRLKDEPDLWTNGYLAGSVAFTAFVWVPMSLFFLSAWTDWDTMYMFSGGSLPVWLTPGFVLAQMTSSVVCFVATHVSLRANNDKLAFAIPILLQIPVLAISLVGLDRVLHVGTVASFQSDGEWNAWTTTLPWALGGVGLYVGVPLVWLVRRWSGRASSEAAPAG